MANSFRKIRALYAENGSADSVMNCDGTAMMCMICPDFITDSRQCHGSCITVRGETYGQVVLSSINLCLYLILSGLLPIP